MYKRNLRKPSPIKHVRKFASAKVNQTIMCESPLEFDACFHHEYNDSIERFESQPEGFYYDFEGEKRPYTPDMLVKFFDGTLKFHEYKPYDMTFDPTFKAEFLAKKAAAQSLGVDLILVTDRQIRVYPLLNNLKILHRYSGVYGLSSIQSDLLNILIAKGKVSLNDLAGKKSLPLGDARAYICSLIHKGLVKANLKLDDLARNPLVWTGK